MKIYFVRHGKTEYNGTGQMTGQTDIPLIAEGIRQAEEASKNMPNDAVVIYSSDLLRCKQTTDILNRGRSIPVIYDSRLRERDFGSLAGNYWEKISPDGSVKAKDVAQEYDYRPYGGEAVQDVQARILAFIEDMKTMHPNGAVVAVTSAGIIRLLHNVVNREVREVIHNSSFHEFTF